MKIRMNLVILGLAWALVTAGGVYFTFFQQPEKLDHLQKAEQVARMKQAELVSLQTEQEYLSELTDEALRKWRARYKIIPEKLSSPDIIGYLNQLTGEGFKNFDVSFGGVTQTADYSYSVFNVTGRSYYTSLYRFIWDIENNRDFYRVDNLTLDHIDLVTEDKELKTQRLQVMVSFSFNLKAYFNGIEGASAPDGMLTAGSEELGRSSSRRSDLPPVPREMLPDIRPAVNPFFPVIMEQLPPNTYGYVDVETAKLVSIVGTKAVFHDEKGYRTVQVGEPVYLGRIAEVDPGNGVVLVRLNRGGIVDQVELTLDTGERFRQAQGARSLSPLQ
jgi:hypothetical protein